MLENVVVEKCYRYKEMQVEMDRMQDRIYQLEDQLEYSLNFEVAM